MWSVLAHKEQQQPDYMNVLKKHPEIFVPEEKELHYFNAVLPPYADNICLTQPFFTTRILIKYLLKITDFCSKSKYGARSMRKTY